MPLCSSPTTPWLQIPFWGPCPNGWNDVNPATSTNPSQGYSPSNPNPGLPPGQNAIQATPQAVAQAGLPAWVNTIGRNITSTAFWKQVGIVAVAILLVFGGVGLLIGSEIAGGNRERV